MTARSSSGLAASVRALARVGSCWSPAFSPDGAQLAFVSDLTGSPQAWRMPVRGGFPQAITAFDDEQVSKLAWSPCGQWLAVEAAPGGGMNSQLYLVRPDGNQLRRITPGERSNNWLNRFSPGGDVLYFSSNMRSAAAMDCFRYDLVSGMSERVADNAGTGMIEDISEDGQQLLLRRVVQRGDSQVYLVDVESRDETLLTPHQPPADFANARFCKDGSQALMIANDQRDMAYLARIALEPGDPSEILRARDNAELVEFALNAEQTLMALIWNEAGRHHLELMPLADAADPVQVELPAEIVDSLAFSPAGRQLALRMTGARMPSDIWLLDLATHAPRQLTRSPHVGVDLASLAPAQLQRYPAHDDLPLSGWFYAPTAVQGPYPTVLSFHGGPEAQEQPRFRSDYQSLLGQGMAVFAPNVRGSSGFGKRFVNLDNGALRFDAIRDIASSVEHLLARGLAAPGRIGIMGGSYGGYMTMAGLAAYPDMFAAGVNLYGVVNFKTFFEHTEAWMASISKREYGDPDTEGELLDALSSINKIDRVRAPVFVLHGENDSNVPIQEAEQVIDALRRRGLPVEVLIFPDEGHGFRKAANRVAADIAIVKFFAQHLLAP